MSYFGKRQLVLAALVVALGTAVYLNWQFSSNKDLIATNTVGSTKELGEAQFVNNSIQGQKTNNSDDAKTKNQNGKSSSTTDISESNSSTDYFLKAQQERQKARDEATDIIKDVFTDVASSEAAKSEAVKQAAEIARGIQEESNIESILKAKGVSDCIVFLHGDECTVVVGKGDVTESAAISIKDTVVGQGGISFEKVKIIESK